MYIVRLLVLEHQNSGLLKFPVVVRRLQLIKNWGTEPQPQEEEGNSKIKSCPAKLKV